MRVFLDFEASSLSDDSYPIEVGWVFEDGPSEAHLIRPAPRWFDWDDDAESLHGISRARLEAEGTPHDVVAHRVLEVLGDHRVYVSAPSWDGKWLSVLLRAAGLPRHAMRFRDCAEAQYEAAAGPLGGVLGGDALEAAVTAVIEGVRETSAQPAHRALADAQQEWRAWLEVGRKGGEAARAIAADRA